jgi:hypothetical protein
MRRSKLFFYLLLFLLPLNLGKHFELAGSYVWGLLVDYLVPTLYLQDVLIVLILLFWFKEKGFPSRETLFKFFNRREIQLLFMFIFASTFSVISSVNETAAFFIYLRYLLYFLLFVYVSYEVSFVNEIPIIQKVLALGLVPLSLLAFLQFIKQGSFFNNYLFFGEQPYGFYTWGILKEPFLGRFIVPAYGLFRHPNVFGGYLALILVWLLPRIKSSKVKVVAFVLGTLALFLTFSVTAIATFEAGLGLYFLMKKAVWPSFLVRVRVGTLFFLAILSLSLAVPLLFNKSGNPSIYRRYDLYYSSWQIFNLNPLFGVGPGGSLVLVDKYFPLNSKDLRFTQPVHNIFMLILSEQGIFALAFIFMLLLMAVQKTFSSGDSFILGITLLQICFLGSFDHYLWTIHQTQILFWLVCGMVFYQPHTLSH